MTGTMSRVCCGPQTQGMVDGAGILCHRGTFGQWMMTSTFNCSSTDIARIGLTAASTPFDIALQKLSTITGRIRDRFGVADMEATIDMLQALVLRIQRHAPDEKSLSKVQRSTRYVVRIVSDILHVGSESMSMLHRNALLRRRYYGDELVHIIKAMASEMLPLYPKDQEFVAVAQHVVLSLNGQAHTSTGSLSWPSDRVLAELQIQGEAAKSIEISQEAFKVSGGQGVGFIYVNRAGPLFATVPLVSSLVSFFVNAGTAVDVPFRFPVRYGFPLVVSREMEADLRSEFVKTVETVGLAEIEDVGVTVNAYSGVDVKFTLAPAQVGGPLRTRVMSGYFICARRTNLRWDRNTCNLRHADTQTGIVCECEGDGEVALFMSLDGEADLNFDFSKASSARVMSDDLDFFTYGGFAISIFMIFATILAMYWISKREYLTTTQQIVVNLCISLFGSVWLEGQRVFFSERCGLRTLHLTPAMLTLLPSHFSALR
jgi:hypothetical protein